MRISHVTTDGLIVLKIGITLLMRKSVERALSVDSKTASEWVKNVWVECEQGYSEEDMYNADETGVFYNMTPD
jgi:hypothetical protein